jgi:hypothetical protein
MASITVHHFLLLIAPLTSERSAVTEAMSIFISERNCVISEVGSAICEDEFLLFFFSST